MQLTDTQHRILVALCRPARGGNGLRAAGDQPGDRRRGLPQRRRGQGAPAHSLPEVRNRRAAHNQKRARLVELVLEGGYLEEDGGRGESSPRRPPSRVGAPGPTEGRRRRPIAIGLAVAAPGGRGGCGPRPRRCVLLRRWGRTTAPPPTNGGRAATAGSASRAPPHPPATPASAPLLSGRDRDGARPGRIAAAAGRERPLPRALPRRPHARPRTSPAGRRTAAAGGLAGSRRTSVAELTLAAGQVQAGALGYELGRDCLASAI